MTCSCRKNYALVLEPFIKLLSRYLGGVNIAFFAVAPPRDRNDPDAPFWTEM